MLERPLDPVLPDPETLVVGLYVAARRDADRQWHRAMIINKFNSLKYEVSSIYFMFFRFEKANLFCRF